MSRKFKILKLTYFIITHLNYSSSLVHYERFVNERRLVGERRKGDDGDQKKELSSCCEKEHKVNFDPVRDLNWMLKFNQNGLISLVVYLLQLLILMFQIFKSIMYASRSTERDPTTKECLDPYLRFCEQVYMIDLCYKIRTDGLFLQMMVILSVQFLVMRLRALFFRMKIAKTNMYQFKKVHLVEANMAFGLELRLTLREWFGLIFNNLNHQCSAVRFEGASRKAALKFNKQMRELDHIDRLFYYNAFNFSSCYQSSEPLEEYQKQIANIESQENNQVSVDLEDQKSSQNSSNQVTWTQYLFNFDLPNRISYIPKPHYRLCVFYFIGMLLFNLINTFVMFIVVICAWVAITFVAIDDNDPSETIWIMLQKLANLKIFVGLINLYLIIIIYAANVFETGFSTYCSMVTFSRSNKIIWLLQQESAFCRENLIKFNTFCNNIKLEAAMNRNFMAPLIEYRSKMVNRLLIDKSFTHTWDLDNLSKHHELLLLKNEGSSKLLVANANNLDSDSELDSTDFHHLRKLFKKSLNQERLQELNENIIYALDLIEMLRYELKDMKEVFTFSLNNNLFFNTIGCGICLAMLLNTSDIKSFVLSILVGIASLVPMLFALFGGAILERVVSTTITITITI